VQHAVADRVAVKKQNAPIPERRTLLSKAGKMPVDLISLG
jgi:hypothetical protein